MVPIAETAKISIHVPAWGTTTAASIAYLLGEISIHVPAWGTTLRHSLFQSFNPFQSTFPRGERQEARAQAEAGRVFQSTFPRGERLQLSVHGGVAGNFNPRSRVGNDKRGTVHYRKTDISIHVPAWGTTANFHKYSLLFYAINIIFLLFIIPSLFSLVLFVLLF